MIGEATIERHRAEAKVRPGVAQGLDRVVVGGEGLVARDQVKGRVAHHHGRLPRRLVAFAAARVARHADDVERQQPAGAAPDVRRAGEPTPRAVVAAQDREPIGDARHRGVLAADLGAVEIVAQGAGGDRRAIEAVREGVRLDGAHGGHLGGGGKGVAGGGEVAGEEALAAA